MLANFAIGTLAGTGDAHFRTITYRNPANTGERAGALPYGMAQAIYRTDYDDHGAMFFRQQSTVCFALAKMALSPEHRATFLRLAWHWRAAARVADIMDEPALD